MTSPDEPLHKADDVDNDAETVILARRRPRPRTVRTGAVTETGTEIVQRPARMTPDGTEIVPRRVPVDTVPIIVPADTELVVRTPSLANRTAPRSRPRVTLPAAAIAFAFVVIVVCCIVVARAPDGGDAPARPVRPVVASLPGDDDATLLAKADAMARQPAPQPGQAAPVIVAPVVIAPAGAVVPSVAPSAAVVEPVAGVPELAPLVPVAVAPPASAAYRAPAAPAGHGHASAKPAPPAPVARPAASAPRSVDGDGFIHVATRHPSAPAAGDKE